MFNQNLTEQHRRFIAAVTMAVEGLEDLHKLTPAIKELGARHAAYGVGRPHYDVAGSVLILTLKEALGDSFTPEVMGAWVDFYNYLAETMQAAAPEV